MMRHFIFAATAALALAAVPALTHPARAQSATAPADPNAGNAMPQPENSLPEGGATSNSAPPAAKPHHHHTHHHRHHAATVTTPDSQATTPPGQMAAPSIEKSRDSAPPATH